ncbi:hypothetical protein [Sorangium sp. So ce204]
MADEKNDWRGDTVKDIVETGTDAAATYALEAAKMSSTAATAAFANNPGVMALATVLPFAVAGVFWTAMNWKRIEAERFWNTLRERWACDDDISREEVAGILESRAEEPAVRETIMRSVRALMDQVDSTSTVPLAALALEYLRDPANKPDSFFRGSVRLLSDLAADELEELRSMLD